MPSPLKIAVLPGDHIGPEIADAAVLALEAANKTFNLGLTFEEFQIGYPSLKANGTTITEKDLKAAAAADGILLAPCDNGGYPPPHDGGINVPGKFRHDLDLYANIRPSRSHAKVPHARVGLDVIIVRENSEGFYPDRNMFEGYGEVTPVEGVAISMRKITAFASNRIAHEAFKLARRRRKHVTIVNKKHILRMTDGLFYNECMKVAAEYPDVKAVSAIVDAFNADIYMTPERYDVVVMTNMFGDIISNLASALSGGLGLGGGINASTEHAMANASHGSAPDIAGKNKANPISMVTSAGMLLGWLGHKHNRKDLLDAEAAIDKAIDASLNDAKTRTADIGGTASCKEAAKAIADHITQR